MAALFHKEAVAFQLKKKLLIRMEACFDDAIGVRVDIQLLGFFVEPLELGTGQFLHLPW